MDVIRPALHHVTMRTARLETMLEWYARVLGAWVMFRNEQAGWLSNDDANHRIAFLALPGIAEDPDKIRHSGLHHTAFEYSNFADLMATYQRLANEGLAPAFCLDHGMTVSLYYEDPEANYVELQCDCFGDWKRSSEWMSQSADFAADPIGTFFDPQKVYDGYCAGVAFEQLHKAMRAGEYLPERLPNIGTPS